MGHKFEPIADGRINETTRWVSRRRHPFNDLRCCRKWEEITARIVVKQSIVISQLAENKREADSYYHFIGNPRIDINELIRMSCTISPNVLQGRHILVLGDTSSFSLKRHIGRIQDAGRIGVLEDNKSPGFFSHVHLAVDAEQGTALGLGDIMLWCREKTDAKTAKQAQWEHRESYKWYVGASNARQATAAARVRTFVFDRDADNYELFEKLCRPAGGDHILVRLHHDRQVVFQGETLRMGECLSRQESLGSYELELPALDHYSSSSGKRIRRKKRTALIEVRSCPVQVKAPANSLYAGQGMDMWAVEAREAGSDLPEGEAPVLWRLLTTHPAGTLEQALQIIRFYLCRWMIEQLFRTMKTEGLNLESTEVETFDGILRQAVMACQAACKVLQLVYARDRQDSQPIEEVFTEQEQKVLVQLNRKFQGTTHAQQNPYPIDQTSWATWVIARLGGWKGYLSQKPPGPTTLVKGLERFAVFVQAHQLFEAQASHLDDLFNTTCA